MIIRVKPQNDKARMALEKPESFRMKMEKATQRRLIKLATGIDLDKAYAERKEGTALVVEIKDARLLQMLPKEHIIKGIHDRMEMHDLKPEVDYVVEVRA